MAIARQIKKETPPAPKLTADERKIEALISKGGTSTKAKPVQDLDDNQKTAIKLLPYQTQLNDIQAILEQMPKRNRPSRHAYILQAIDEKIERDQKRLKSKAD